MGPAGLGAGLFAEDLSKADEDTAFRLPLPRQTGTRSRPTFTGGCGAPR